MFLLLLITTLSVYSSLIGKNWQGSYITSLVPFVGRNECYPGDTYQRVAFYQVAVDYGFYQSVGDEAVVEEVKSLFALTQLIWSAQLGIRLELTNVIVGTLESPKPLSYTMDTCEDAFSAFDQLQLIGFETSTIFISNCFLPGTSDIGGEAYIGSYGWGATSISSTSPKDIAHEIGHSFGLQHSFENGVGTTGGIMDYGNGLYNGSYQIYPGQMNSVCDFLSAIVLAPSTTGTCGDFVLTREEECECFNGSTNCTDCIDCMITHPISCSFLCALHQPNDAPYVHVDSYRIPSMDCCTDSGSILVNTECDGNGGEGGICGISGSCLRPCEELGYESCGISCDGCRQKCIVNGICTAYDDDYLSIDGFTLNSNADYSPCGNNGEGICLNGDCIGIEYDEYETKTLTVTPTMSTNTPTIPIVCSLIKTKSKCTSPCNWSHKKCMSHK